MISDESGHEGRIRDEAATGRRSRLAIRDPVHAIPLVRRSPSYRVFVTSFRCTGMPVLAARIDLVLSYAFNRELVFIRAQLALWRARTRVRGPVW